MPVMVRLRKREVFIGKVFQLFRGILRRKLSGPHCIKNFFDLPVMQ